MMQQNDRIRVVIRVIDDAIRDEEPESVLVSQAITRKVPRKPINADVDVIDPTTLTMKLSLQQPRPRTVKTRTLRFDAVAKTQHDPLIRVELASLVDQLLLDRQNCCWLHLHPIRDTPKLSELISSLIFEVDKRMQLLNAEMPLQSIKLEYCDIQKYDLVNMLQYATGGKPKSLPKSRIEFRYIKDWARWIQVDYRTLWNYGNGHEYLDMELVFGENSVMQLNQKLKLKLSVVAFYLNKMDLHMKTGLQNFLKDAKSRRSIKQSLLSDLLRDFLFSKDKWSVWMIFDVYSTNFGGKITNDIITLASAAYYNAHEKNAEGTLHTMDMELDLPSTFSTNDSQFQSDGSIVCPIRSASNLDPKMSGHKQDTTLSYWYCKLDACYINVIAAMERYYDRKHELKICKMCGDLKRMANIIDQDLAGKNASRSDNEDMNADEVLQTYYRQYKEAMITYRSVIRQVENSRFAEQLKAFVKTKGSELAQHTRQMRLRQLESCATRLTDTIKSEVRALNTNDTEIVY